MNKKLQIPLWIWKTMKITFHQFVLLALCYGMAYAHDLNGQNVLEKSVTLHAEGLRFKKVLSLIEDQADIRFVYSSSAIDTGQKVNLKVSNKKLDLVLRELLQPLSVDFSVTENRILLKSVAPVQPEKNKPFPTDSDQSVKEADKIIRGKVTDETGEGLPGVSIVVEDTRQGTISDAQGQYQISIVDENTTLIFSFVGYVSQEIVVGNKNSIDISLRADEKALEEVVVVGYGTQKKVNLTGSVTSLNEKDFGRRMVGQSSMLLQGIAPGVTVTQSSGQPGKDVGTIRIRGIGTIGDSNPMVLVDGVEMSMNNIDPGTIESISVLKDASSAAIYGSRAANGVILITTKRAKQGQSLVQYNAYYGWDQPTNLPHKVNALDHMELLDKAYINSGRSPIYEKLISQYKEDAGKNSDLFPDTDWMDLLMKSGRRQNHLLSFNKGTEKLKVAASFGYLKQEGIIDNTSYERVNFRVNTDMEISSKLSAKFDLMLNHGNRPEPISEGEDINSIFFQMYRIPANQPAIFSNGTYGEGWTGSNPLAWANEGGLRTLKSPQASMNFQFNYQLTPWLTANVVFAPIYSVNHTKSFVKELSLYNADGSLLVKRPSLSTLTEEYARALSKTLRGSIQADKNLSQHHLKVLVGYSMEDYTNYSFSGYRENFHLTQYQVLDAGGNDNKNSNGSAGDWALVSFFGRVNYDYKGKYLLEATGRYDGSSRFSLKNRFAAFPSFSMGWRIIEEDFMKPVQSFVSDLKLRGSWGLLGNQNIGNSFYPYVSSVPLTVNYTFGNSIATGARLTDLANEELKWEQTEMTNIGLDIDISNKLTITADYFRKETKDILLRLNIPGSLGLSAPYQNAGRVSNKGWELGVKYRNNINLFNYSIAGAISDVINKIEDLRGISSTSLTQNREGYAMNSLFGLVADGYFQNEQDIAEAPKQYGIGLYPGDIRYKDLDQNGVIDDNDREVFGNTIPRFTYSLNLNADYKRFDLGVFFQGVGKVDGFLYNAAIMPFYNGGTIYEIHKNYWTPENTNADFPRLAFDQANNQRLSSFWMKSASYLRLKNIQLGYSFQPTLLHKIGVRSLKLVATGENLLTLNSFWSGFDVEAPVGTGNFYPQMKTYSLGINISL